jgi:hypothetical protein
MTPKEKAIELVNKYLQIYDGRVNIAKQCSFFAVDEIIKNDKENYGINGFVFEYWQKVKQEIEKL